MAYLLFWRRVVLYSALAVIVTSLAVIAFL